MTPMKSRRLVRPEHLNHHGYMFGGTLLQWLDEQAYMAVADMVREDANLVTVGIDNVVFQAPVKLGTVLVFETAIAHVGRSSLTVFVDVYYGRGVQQRVFGAYVTFVCIDENNKPRPIADFMLETVTRESLDEDGRARWDEVERQRASRKKIRTMVDDCIAGVVTAADINKYIEGWHRGAVQCQLHEYLGFTPDEYAAWVENRMTAEEIVSGKKTK
jgi:acyl-CoA hydrolase